VFTDLLAYLLTYLFTYYGTSTKTQNYDKTLFKNVDELKKRLVEV